MAKRRMLTISIVETDRFYRLKSTEQALYLHLNLNADDDGVVDRVKSVMRDTRASAKNLQTLIDEGYIIDLGRGLALITHWHQHNRIKKDRYVPSVYGKLISQILQDPNGIYIKPSEGIFGDKGVPQVSIDKDSIDKESTDKRSAEKDSIEKLSVEKKNESNNDKENNKQTNIHSFNTEEDLKISSDNGFAEELTSNDIQYKRFISRVKLYFLTAYKSLDCEDFIRYYESINWRGDNGESVKDNYVEYIKRWYGEP